VDKPISDPIFSQQTQQVQQPQPQPQQPIQQPIPPQQPIPGSGGTQVGDPSTQHLSPPHPMDDPNLRTMSFDEMGSDGGDESSEGSDEGGKQNIKLPQAEVHEFAKVIVQVGSMYIPVFLSKFAKIKITELELGEHQGVFPAGTVDFFKQINLKTEQGLAITEEEQKMLLSALKSYLQWKNIEAANPGTALAIAVGAVILRLGLATAQFMAENRAMYKQFLSQFSNLEGEEVKTEEPTKKEG